MHACTLFTGSCHSSINQSQGIFVMLRHALTGYSGCPFVHWATVSMTCSVHMCPHPWHPCKAAVTFGCHETSSPFALHSQSCSQTIRSCWPGSSTLKGSEGFHEEKEKKHFNCVSVLQVQTESMGTVGCLLLLLLLLFALNFSLLSRSL